MDHELESVRTAAVEGVAKLMMMDELVSAPLFSHLVLLFFNPATEDDTLLRQCLRHALAWLSLVCVWGCVCC